MKSLAPITLGLASIAAAAPSKTLEKRASLCGQWDSTVTGSYTIYQDLWGEASATSGSQCTTVESLSGNILAWKTEWNWEGASSSVKSFANAAYSFTSKEISAISSIPTTWDWSYTGSSIVADVAYDLFTSSSASGSAEYEIMIWLAALGGAGPISSSGSPITSPTIGGVTWNLYSGPNGATTVYSFVATSQQTNFSGDIHNFLEYLVENEGLSSSQYLLSIQAGTEPFTGSGATLSTSAYTVSVS
ncbi:endoglucanase [Talaromyces proteolyticus]|uniref:xyloglucan-specific endo-beta-1,4-glucanase n=1 Tax=Talaromyces proteolyticus TaxID=1131652 RepID=A0AAD4L1L8_9EURO|nr:endoglucanase [Talaromyces proteolyticus]KAH8702461.1 endoglucanase [Talaromyces proteolyticus]